MPVKNKQSFPKTANKKKSTYLKNIGKCSPPVCSPTTLPGNGICIVCQYDWTSDELNVQSCGTVNSRTCLQLNGFTSTNTVVRSGYSCLECAMQLYEKAIGDQQYPACPFKRLPFAHLQTSDALYKAFSSVEPQRTLAMIAELTKLRLRRRVAARRAWRARRSSQRAPLSARRPSLYEATASCSERRSRLPSEKIRTQKIAFFG